MASGPTGRYKWNDWDKDGAYGDWYGAHELGHTFGRSHVGACGAPTDDLGFPNSNGTISETNHATGLDVGDTAYSSILHTAALPGTQWTDVMSYCNYAWMSKYTYQALLDRLQAEDAQNGGVEQGWAVGSQPQDEHGGAPARDEGNGEGNGGQYLRVIARVNLTQGTAEILFAETTDGRIKPALPKKSDAVIGVLNTTGAMVNETPVALMEGTDAPYGTDRIALINAVVPKGSAIGAFQLAYRGTVVAERRVTKASPRVTDVKIKWSDAKHKRTGLIVWNATDADNATDLRYRVQLSLDGSDYDTMVFGLTERSVSIDAAQFRGAKLIRARVIANDGFNTGEAESKSTPVPH